VAVVTSAVFRHQIKQRSNKKKQRKVETMTTRALKFLAIAAGGVFAIPALAQASTWELDPVHSTIEFSVRHMMVSTVKGQFEKVKGTIELDDKDITKSTVEVTIEPGSVSTHDPKRDGHLKSPDFFDVAKYPTATFKSTKVQKAGKNKLKVTGDLTLHGVTKPVVLDVEGPTAAFKSPFGTTVRGAHATGKIDRKDFDIGWNKVLDNGGVVVGNEVSLELNAELTEKVAPAAAAPAAAPAPAAKPAAAPAAPAAKPAVAPAAKPAK
jgi:polyisoprenoid-binding protein YceI